MAQVGAEAPKAHKEFNKTLEIKKASVNMKTPNDINWSILEPIMTYKVNLCNNFAISTKRPNKP